MPWPPISALPISPVAALRAKPSGSGGKLSLAPIEKVYGAAPPLAAIVQPAYALPCVPPGHDVVVIVNAPPLAFTVTVAVEVADPAAFFAVSVYVVVAAGLTLVDPLAAAEVNVPGVIATFAAPLVTQLSVLLPLAVMLVGLAVNELIVGLLAAFTVTTAVAVVEPAALVAVSV